MNGQVVEPLQLQVAKHENNKSPQPQTPSRIPVATSVFSFPLRRWGSLKLSNGNQHHLIQDPPVVKFPKVIQETNQNGIIPGTNFKRGYSFMERGEKKRGAHGVRPSAMAIRPNLNTAEPRNLGALNRANPKSPNRNPNLTLSLVAVRRPSSSKSPLGETPKTPPSSPDTRNRFYRDWDLDSVASTNSGISVASCDHASVAHNGTTFSGKTKRFVVHCSEHAGATGDEYLTPTQRAHKEVKKLKSLLQQTQRELDTKNTNILRLTKEVVELRIYKAALNSPEDKSTSSDGITVREVIETPVCVDGIVENHIHVDRVSSGADSGHFDDFTNSSIHSKDSVHIGDETSLSPYKRRTETADKSVTADLGPKDPNSEHQRLVVEYERQLQDLVRTHENECHLMKQKHNDKVDELLLRLSDVNARYWELVPDLDSARERIKELEKELDEVSKRLEEKESYFEVYSKEKSDNQIEGNHVEELQSPMQNPSRVSVPELLHQLEVTQNELDKVKDLDYASSSNNSQPLLSAKEAVSLWVLGARKAMYHQLMEARSKNKVDPEITLQFLKSAIYYFLTDKENNQGHLKAIQSILGFTPNEISNIDKARMAT